MIKDKLKEVRERTGMNKKEFAEYIGIKYTTYNNYETGAREPDSEFLVMFSRKFNVSTDFILGLQEDKEILYSYELKASEFEHIEKYRSLDPHGQQTVDIILDRETERVRQLQETKNPLGSPTATIIEIQPWPVTDVRLTKYFHSASAGGGVFILGNESTEKISVPATPENEIVDYVIKVTGDSMEPDYHDGDNVMVSQRVEMRHGDVGIFVVVCKEKVK